MTRQRRSSDSRYSQGFSLVELMVSMTIGLVIMVAAISAYLGAAGASKMSDAQSRMNEDAQAALSILTQQLRMAGTNPVQAGRDIAFRHNPVYDPTYAGGTSAAYGTTSYTASAALSAFSIRGCEGKFSNIGTAGTTLDTLTCGGTSTLPDSIAVSYEADRYNTIPTSVGNTPTDCLGNGVTATTATFPSGTVTNATYFVADNRFYIGTSTVIVSPSLYCRGNGGASTAQPLVENIEDMQFTYGTVSTTNTTTTATVAGYLTADAVNTQTDLAALPVQDRWGKVLSVRICVLVRSENPVAPDAASAKYVPCAGGSAISAPDLRLRRAYATTVVLRNRRF